MKRETTTYDLTSISKTVAPLAKKLLGKKGLVEVDLIINWNSIVGDDFACFSVPQSIKFPRNERANGTLELSVPAGAFALEVQARKTVLIEKINAFFGYAAIKDIKTIQSNSFSCAKQNVEDQKKRLVSLEEENYIKETISEIKSQTLKDALQNLGQSILGNKNKGNKKHEV